MRGAGWGERRRAGGGWGRGRWWGVAGWLWPGFFEGFDGAFEAAGDGGLVGGEGGGDLGLGLALEIVEDEGEAEFFGEGGDGLVDEGFDLRPGGIGRGVLEVELGGGLFVAAAGVAAADEVGGAEGGGGVKPAGGGGFDGVGFAGEFEEAVLGDVLGIGVVMGEAEGGGINERGVAADELGEGVGALGAGVAFGGVRCRRRWSWFFLREGF